MVHWINNKLCEECNTIKTKNNYNKQGKICNQCYNRLDAKERIKLNIKGE